MFRDLGDLVIVNGFEMTAQNFATIEPLYTGLPPGIIERRYDPSAPPGRPKHVLITDDPSQIAGPVPFPEGDAILAKASQYPELHDETFPPRRPPDPGPPLRPDEIIDRRIFDDPLMFAFLEEIALLTGEAATDVLARMKQRAVRGRSP